MVKSFLAAVGTALSLTVSAAVAQTVSSTSMQPSSGTPEQNTPSSCTGVRGGVVAGLPSGTRIYRVDALEFDRDDGLGVAVTLPGDVVSYDDHSYSTRLRDGSVKTWTGYHFQCRWSRELAVKPGDNLPGFMLGLEPVRIIP
jgi:signal peptidase I